MDIRYKYVKEYVDNGVVKIVLVKSAETDSNILINADLHEKHSTKIVGEKLNAHSFKNIRS